MPYVAGIHVFGVKGYAAAPLIALFQEELMIVVEIDAVRSLLVIPRGITFDADHYVVVKFVVIEKIASSACVGVDGSVVAVAGKMIILNKERIHRQLG